VGGSHFMQGWIALAGSLATIALILTAFGLMLGVVKLADILPRVAGILGLVMLLMALPNVLASLWLGMSLWQRLGLAAISIGLWQWRRPRSQTRKKGS